MISVASHDTIVERARRDSDFVREALCEAEVLLLGGERDAAEIMLRNLAQGAPKAEVAVNLAANLLGVSQAHVEQLIQTGHIAGHGGETNRGIMLVDLVSFRERRMAESKAALDALALEAQTLNLEYGRKGAKRRT